jgi:hypothetical protein
MSIFRIVCGPSDLDGGGYRWYNSDITGANTALWDNTRVAGAFEIDPAGGITLPTGAPSGNDTWYHFRYAHDSDSLFNDDIFARIQDSNSETLAYLLYTDSRVSMAVVGADGSANRSFTGTQALAINTTYSMDLHVTVDATISCRWYINGALYGEVSVPNSLSKGKAVNLTFENDDGNQTFYVSEIAVADEDTRGMRIREMRPTSYGIFQEWDGSINSLRDTDRATGISTDVADRRVTFGVTNLEYINAGDVINRVVSQTFAQKGETGLSKFNHSFRHRNGNVTDGIDHVLGVLGQRYIEEFPLNPDTSLAWEPEDFGSLQTGLKSKL